MGENGSSQGATETLRRRRALPTRFAAGSTDLRRFRADPATDLSTRTLRAAAPAAAPKPAIPMTSLMSPLPRRGRLATFALLAVLTLGVGLEAAAQVVTPPTGRRVRALPCARKVRRAGP